MDAVWTDAKEARLKVLWAQGCSHSQVAADLDCGFSRSAIAGKIMRLKLPPRDKGHPSPISSIRVPRAPQSRQAPQLRRNPSNSLAKKIEIAEAEPGLTERLKGEKPDGTGIQLHQLNELNCHFPKGDPLEDDFEFCGARAIPGMPYCAHHCRISYSAPTPSRRERPRV